jgi:hypothetical protein
MSGILLARPAPDWGADPIARMKWDRNAIEIPRYARIEAGFSAQVQTIVSSLQQGLLSRRQATDRFSDALAVAETEAFVSGRRARGVARDFVSDAEEAMLEGRHIRQVEYFSRFAGDVLDSKGKMPYHLRAAGYAQALWSLFVRGESAFWEEPDRQARYHWETDIDAEHCHDCLTRLKLSRERGGLTWDELVALGFPGENTACMFRCRCHIRVQGTRGVRQPDGPSNTPKQGLQTLEDILGGPTYPEPISAAGVAGVHVAPSAIQHSLRLAGGDSHDLSRSLPLLPLTLQRPASIHHEDSGDRIYVGWNLGAAIRRGIDGLWHLVMVALNRFAEAAQSLTIGLGERAAWR